MYGLERGVNLAFFTGKILLQICIGCHDLILNFDGDVSVTVTSGLACVEPDRAMQRYDDFCEAAPKVLEFLNQAVLFVEGDEAGTLTLKFDGGGTLSIYDDSKEYESYTIKNGSQLIVV
jgi:hypothetical protein